MSVFSCDSTNVCNQSQRSTLKSGVVLAAVIGWFRPSIAVTLVTMKLYFRQVGFIGAKHFYWEQATAGSKPQFYYVLVANCHSFMDMVVASSAIVLWMWRLQALS